MSDSIIKVENLSKSYTIRHQTGEHYTALRDVVTNGVKSMGNRLLRRTNGHVDNSSEEFWALNDVSFEVKQGERVGIIGRNGAGKSTLLKILSRITEPTSGRVHIRGRVASLLEVGTGFHPELTGRENVYLNGAILGMSREEIRRKFDEIVAFAEVEKFLDTPVKRYSSGMYVRLAFAVAAHLEPEILVVDEVLAVGDAAFQKKCLGKMENVTREGRTVLFVSHNMAAIQQLCTNAVLLNDGQIAYSGIVNEAVSLYMNSALQVSSRGLTNRQDRKGNQSLKFVKVEILDLSGQKIETVLSGQDIQIKFYYIALESRRDMRVNVAIGITHYGNLLINMNSLASTQDTFDIYKEGFFLCTWKNFNLTSGLYDCILFCSINGEIADWIESAFSIQVENGDFFGTGNLQHYSTVLVPHTWSCWNTNHEQ